MDYTTKRKRKIDPRENANFLSKITFLYTLGIFRSAIKRNLNADDLPYILKCCQAKRCGDKFEKLLRKTHKKTPFQLIFEGYGPIYLLIGLAELVIAIFISIMDPYTMGNFVASFNGQQVNYENATFYGTLVITVTFLITFYYHNMLMMQYRLSLQIRSSLSSLIYRKSLKLSSSSLDSISLGNIVTMITKDIYAIEMAAWIFIDLFVHMTKTLTVCYLLYNKMGNVGFVGIVFVFSVLPVHGKYLLVIPIFFATSSNLAIILVLFCSFCFPVCLLRSITRLRLNLNKRTDERLQITRTTLSCIKLIKIFTWEQIFLNYITDKRKKEVQMILTVMYRKVIVVIVGVLNTRIGFYILIMTYVWLGNVTNAEFIFYVLTLYQTLRQTLGVSIPLSLGFYGDIIAASKRIVKLLEAEEFSDDSQISWNDQISLKNVTLEMKNQVLLENITLDIPKGLTVLTGEVGSGKTNLLKLMIRDYVPTSGSLTISQQVSYAPQEPWLFPSTIRQNILFGSEHNKERYKEVIRVCDLEYDFDLLENGDMTIVSDKGSNLSRGQQARINLARALYKQSQIYILDDCLSSLDNNVQNFVFLEGICKYLNGKTCIFVSQNSKHVQKADQVVVLQKGQLQFCGKPIKSSAISYEKLVRNDVGNNIGENHVEANETDELLAKEHVYSENPKKGVVELDTFLKYFKFGGGFLVFCLPVFFYLSGQSVENYNDKLISEWADLQQKILNYTINNSTNTDDFNETMESNKKTIVLYTITIIIETLLTLIKTYFLYNFCRKASLNVHTKMLDSIMNASMKFFDKHYIGNILNRFSQDLYVVDENLSYTISEGIRVIFAIIGTMILVSTINYLFLLPMTVLFLLFWMIRRYYINAGRSLKRLEAALRSPMIGYLNTTLEGLPTIRAFKAQKLLINEFDSHQDLCNSAAFTWITAFIAFAFFSDLINTLIVTNVVLGLILLSPEISAGSAGLALTQMISMGATINWANMLSARMETEMTSVERCLEFTEVEQETKTGIGFKENWPDNGSICFENVSLSYNGKERALKNVSFTVEPNQKIGIVGRTGAGKTSILSVLFKLYNFDGKITIDRLDIKQVSNKFLRRNITVIPQNPVLFNGTVRENLDPNNKYKPDELWNVLKQVQLDKIITDLSWNITKDGINFSAGQKQLICLARAILNRNKIVILDEATAALDQQNEILIQNIVKENFENCTVIIIAHRLSSVMDCDRIIVFKEGQIIENDAPFSLLSNENSLFRKMVHQIDFK